MTTEAEYRDLLKKARNALQYNREQTRPIQLTTDTLAEIDSALSAPATAPKPMFAELIAQHEGLAEELAAMDAPATASEPECIVCTKCGHENWIHEGKAQCQVVTPTDAAIKGTP